MKKAVRTETRKGRGDYSKDRHKYLDKMTIADIMAGIKQMRAKKS